MARQAPLEISAIDSYAYSLPYLQFDALAVDQPLWAERPAAAGDTPVAGRHPGAHGMSSQIVGMVTQQQQLMCLLVSAVLLARFCWFNRRQAGLVLAAVGITLNMTVMVLNGGTMPVSSAVVRQVLGTEAETARLIPLSKGTIVDDSAAPLHWLGDRLLLPGPLARIAAWSLGDVFLLAGVWWLLWQTMKGQHNDRHPFLRHAPS